MILSFKYRCCDETFQIQDKQVTINHPNDTNILKHEVLTCPTDPNSGSLSSNPTNSDIDIEETKVCEFGTFQDYRLEHGDTKLVSVENEGKNINVNRTWLKLPNLDIPIQSDTYCVRKIMRI